MEGIGGGREKSGTALLRSGEAALRLRAASRMALQGSMDGIVRGTREETGTSEELWMMTNGCGSARSGAPRNARGTADSTLRKHRGAVEKIALGLQGSEISSRGF
jgi:hypothetical protein